MTNLDSDLVVERYKHVLGQMTRIDEGAHKFLSLFQVTVTALLGAGGSLWLLHVEWGIGLAEARLAIEVDSGSYSGTWTLHGSTLGYWDVCLDGLSPGRGRLGRQRCEFATEPRKLEASVAMARVLHDFVGVGGLPRRASDRLVVGVAQPCIAVGTRL